MKEILSPEEHKGLRLQHRSEKDGRKRDRIKAILLSDKGWTFKMIAEALLLDEETIKFYTEQGKGNLSKGVRQHWRSLIKRAADVCHESSDGVHEWYQGSSWLICSHCGTRR